MAACADYIYDRGKSHRHAPGFAYAEYIRRMPDALHPSLLRRTQKVRLTPQDLRALPLELFARSSV